MREWIKDEFPSAFNPSNVRLQVVFSKCMPPINSNRCSSWLLVLFIKVFKFYFYLFFCFVSRSVGCRNSNRVVGVYRIATFIFVYKCSLINNLGMRIAFASINTIIVFLVNIAIFSKVWQSAYREFRYFSTVVGCSEFDCRTIALIHGNAVVGIANLFAIKIQLWRDFIAFCRWHIFIFCTTRNKGVSRMSSSTIRAAICPSKGIFDFFIGYVWSKLQLAMHVNSVINVSCCYANAIVVAVIRSLVWWESLFNSRIQSIWVNMEVIFYVLITWSARAYTYRVVVC